MPATQRSPQSFEPRPKPKRIKIDVACDTCRARKIKCDGVRPACGNCFKKPSLREKCIYSHNGSSAAPRRSLDIQTTIPNRREQEDHGLLRGRSHTYSTDSGLRNDAHLSRLNTNPSHREPLRPSSVSHPSPAERSTGDYSGGSRPAVNNISPSVIDSMTAVVDEGASTREYFGSSSAGSFTKQIKKAIEAKLGKSNQYLRDREDELTSRRTRLAPTTSSHSVVNDANRVLPTRRQADHLMGLYWTYVDPLYPFLDREKWDQSYRGIFNGSVIDVEEHTFLATLNVIFALSTQLFESQTPEQRDESSNVYFNRAQELLPLNTWDAGSIELVQYLLLTSQYLQSTDRPHQTWMTVGSAVRIAQGLGLHLCETSAEQLDANERELYRRIWYGCVLMDRMVAVTHGRPSMISPSLASVVPFPLYSMSSDVAENGVLQTDASFFVKSVELYEIIHRTIRALYHGTGARCKNVAASENESSSGEETQIDLGTVMQLDSALGKWERKLPERLKQGSAEPRSEVTHRQAVVLHIRLLHARILLLRPLLASFCLSYQAESLDASETLESRVLRECALLCVTTAQGIISMLLKYQTVDDTVGLLPAWWYRVYYVYTAATVLIAANLRPEVFSGADLSRSWGQAMSVLKIHEKFGQSARRCVAALHFLSTKMMQDSVGHEGPRGCTGRVEDGEENRTMEGSADLQQGQVADGFPFSLGDLDHLGFQDVEFDVNNLSWLNDMHGTWEILNHG